MIINFKSFLLEGGNIRIGDVGADPINLRTTQRSARQQDLHDSLHALNNSHLTKFGGHLFGNKGEAINSGGAYAGSTKPFMSPEIPDKEHVKYKPSVGDIDTMYNEDEKPNIEKSLAPGSRYGKFTVVGSKKHGSQISAIMKHDDGQHHQIDFEPSKYENNSPSEWNQFSHSSNWDDNKQGIKGVFHKLALSALTAAHGQHAIVRSKKGDAEKFAENDTFSTDHGIRSKHEPIGQEGTKPVLREKTPKESVYNNDIPTIYNRLIGKPGTRQDLHDFGNYQGIMKLAKKHLDPEQQGRFTDKFLHSIYHPDRAKIVGSSPEDDEAMKERALSHFRKHFPNHFTPEKEQEILDNKRAFYTKPQGNEK